MICRLVKLSSAISYPFLCNDCGLPQQLAQSCKIFFHLTYSFKLNMSSNMHSWVALLLDKCYCQASILISDKHYAG